MTDQSHIFSVFTAVIPGDWKVKGIGTDSSLQVYGYGTVKIRSKVNGVWYDGSLKKVLYVPNLGITLFSIGAATDLGSVVTFDKNQIRICQNNTQVAAGKRSNKDDLYYLDIEVAPTTTNALVSTSSVPLGTWHQRLGHIRTEIIKSMKSSNCVTGLQMSEAEEGTVQCEGCAYGKSHRLPFTSSGHIKKTKIGQLIHSDLCGPMSVASPSGASYFLTFKDDFTGFRVLYFLTHKFQVLYFNQLYSA